MIYLFALVVFAGEQASYFPATALQEIGWQPASAETAKVSLLPALFSDCILQPFPDRIELIFHDSVYTETEWEQMTGKKIASILHKGPPCYRCANPECYKCRGGVGLPCSKCGGDVSPAYQKLFSADTQSGTETWISNPQKRVVAKYLWVAAFLLALCVALRLLPLYIYKHSSEPLGVINRQLTEFRSSRWTGDYSQRKRDLRRAYSFCSTSFQEKFSLEDFRSIVSPR